MATDNKQTTNTATPFMGMEAQILADTLQTINKLAARVERLEGLFAELVGRLEEIEDKTDALPELIADMKILSARTLRLAASI